MAFDWKALVGTVAPWIGTALGGPLGGLAVTAIGDALGLSDKTESTIAEALRGVTPEQMLALKNADQSFALHMQELGFKNMADLEKIAADDRASARSMQIASKSIMPAVLSVIVVTGFLGLLLGMMTGELKVSESQALLIMLGALGSAFGAVMAFWFGTTHDSGKKTDGLIAASKP